ncbi:hypothetical protein LBMAG48_17370 [Phycisphaerae bacterium]|nr:hypothetical protein LBMAG48_17370 [Phycisphaerae bacterium]
MNDIESIAPVESTPVNTPASASIPQSTSQPRVPFTRRRWLTIALISFIITLLAGGLMTARIRTFLKANPPEVYVFRKVDKREFIYAGRPVTLLDDNTNPQTPTLVLSYGEATQRIPVTVANVDRPQRNALPGLLPHEDWLRVLRMARVTGETPKSFLAKLDKGEVPDRLVIVARIPRPGSDPATWGSVWKKDWQFDFYELLPSGEIAKYPRLAYPTTRGMKKPKDGELHEGTWEYQAALQTMPQAGAIGPTRNFFGNAIAAASWTLPLAAFAGLTCTYALIFGLAPTRKTTNAGKSFREA